MKGIYQHCGEAHFPAIWLNLILGKSPLGTWHFGYRTDH